ncbi:MAG TPA: SRPBCC family protein [Solirubrobacterales bacterium]|jgi:uncharacterized protein YndB with AHSA1/START domain
MTERSVEHASFSFERVYDASPAQVFAAWADPAAKAQWFRNPEGWEDGPYELDFRVGGRESASGGPKGGPVHEYRALYWDIVPDERIVYSYEMLEDGTRVSVSLAIMELEPGGSTRLTLTEHGAFLDGLDSAARRRQGMGSLLDALGETLSGDDHAGR